MDLPLLTGDEVPHEPHLALTARPWPGGVALYSSPQDSNYILQDIMRFRSTVGILQTPLRDGPLGCWDRQEMQVKLVSGSLSSAAPEVVFSGANTLAVGDGSPDNWEIIQFADAQPVAPRTYVLTRLLRGQAGSDGIMPGTWPAGTKVVLLNQRAEQITIPTASRGNPRHYRYGPVKQPVSARSFRHRVLTFKGNGYRPYPVAHLRAAPDGSAFDITWIRRTRIDGDQWGAGEVPLGEADERYVLRIMQGSTIKREVTLTSPEFRYTGTMHTADVGGGDFVVAVAQVSDRYGPGLFRKITVTG